MFKQVIGVSVKEGPLIVPCTGSSLASHVRKKVTVFLLDRFDEREQCTVRNASNAR